jgi:ABC-type multidrug transport system fused ATPase/permease subunit
VVVYYILYQGQLLEYTNNLLNSFSNLVKSAGAGAKVFELLARRPQLQGRGRGDEEGAKWSAGGAKALGRVEFDRVSFAYPSRPAAPVLRGLSFVAEPGQVRETPRCL